MSPGELLVRIRIEGPPLISFALGSHAGQRESPWNRRAKVSIEGLRPLLLAQQPSLAQGAVAVATIR